MSYQCEDYPCCGCGPEGCIDRSRIVECEDCGKRFHPDQNTERFCYTCQCRHEIRMGRCDPEYDDDRYMDGPDLDDRDFE